jgi:hypothetical protein
MMMMILTIILTELDDGALKAATWSFRRNENRKNH